MESNTINGTYGSHNTPCTIYTNTRTSGATWYAVEGSLNVNATMDCLVEGVDVETVDDHDMFTAAVPINSEEILEEQVDL